jgi:hypothetical protein
MDLPSASPAASPAASTAVASPRVRWLILGALFAAIVFAYVFFVSAGKLSGFPEWPTYNINFDLQADGFRSGHLYMSLAPAPELLAAEDPYSPVNSNYWARDFSLYKGHYYLYWGPAPAIFLAIVKSVLRIKGVVGDQYLCFASYVLYLLAGMLLIERMARRLFPRAPFALTILGILAYAFANPTPYLLATPGVYQTAIVAGQSFLVLGCLFAFESILPAVRRPGLRRGALLGAGIAWALAIACRASVGPAVLVLALISLLATWRRPGEPSAPRAIGVRVRAAVWLITPIIVGVAGLLLFNKLRFESWLDFGQRYQLNDPGLRFRASLAYVWPNIYSYLLRPVVRTCHFPFAKTTWDIGLRAFPKGFVAPAGYMIAEPVAGILPQMCWSWLAPLGWWAGLRLALRARRAPGGLLASDHGTRGIIWAAACFATLATLTALPWIAAFSTTMRYIADVSTGLALSGMLGAWWLHAQTRDNRARRIIVVTLIVALAGTTVVLGALLGFGGYIEHFRHFNPELMDRLEATLSVCRP